jgi:hypothetical protein
VAPEVAAPVELIAVGHSVEADSAAGDRVVAATGNGPLAVRIVAAWDHAERALAADDLAAVDSDPVDSAVPVLAGKDSVASAAGDKPATVAIAPAASDALAAGRMLPVIGRAANEVAASARGSALAAPMAGRELIDQAQAAPTARPMATTTARDAGRGVAAIKDQLAADGMQTGRTAAARGRTIARSANRATAIAAMRAAPPISSSR